MPSHFCQVDQLLTTLFKGAARNPWPAAAALSLCLAPLPEAHGDPWLAPGDGALRHDLQLLADAGFVHAPLTTWPVSWPEVLRDLGRANEAGQPMHITAALGRVRRAANAATNLGSLALEASIAGSENPMALRRFDDVPREKGEASVSAQYLSEHFGFRAQATGVADAADGKEIRPDGSYVAAVAGNWVLHAGWIDRWWGPGWEGSLIYGSNARPIPSITIERNYSDPVDHPWLSWIGQWRFAVTMGQLEEERTDAPNAQLFGLRATWKPHQRIEIGISRTAQWCGDGRPCDLDTFWDLLTGNDNDQPLAEQPGNQMAGFDARWSVPGLPVALYAQAIGEDEADFLPSKYLGLAGVEFWGGLGDRSWRLHLEAADTACSFYENPPQFGCAYHNTIYHDGYQYYDRVIGHALDGDSRQVAAGAMLVAGDGSSWELALQSAEVNRRSANDVHSVAPVATDIHSVDLHHRRNLLGGDLRVGIGYEEREAAAQGGSQDDIRGYLQWSGRF
jgi:Capsule assembly protein Wzi